MTSGEPPYPLISADTYDVWRLERGIPSWGIDMGLRTLPPEMGPAFESRYVSYTKGCYMGQEVLQRIHSRGHTNWTWAGLLSDVAIPVGATVDHASRARAGTVTSSGYSPALGNIAAVRLRNEAATPGDTVFIGEGQARVVEMPLIR
jgi:folate-binding protein YgfZ